MARSLGKYFVFVLILLLGFHVIIQADVKLRIYMQDGSLKAGNFVSETEENFVVLTKSGREEIPKNKIMFVNGKTLAQWQARPDKLFQTEILPAEIPNASYVNNKSAIPVLPSVPKKESTSVPPIKGPVKQESPMPKEEVLSPEEDDVPVKTVSPKVEAAGAEQANPLPMQHPSTVPVVKPLASPSMVPLSSESNPPVIKPVAPILSAPIKKEVVIPVPVETAKVQTPPSVSPVASVHPARPHRIRVAKEKIVAPVPPPVVIEKASSPKPNLPVRPVNFARETMADYHWKLAQALVEQNQPGQAIQELHMATVLNRSHVEGLLLMGELYKSQDSFEKALKYYKLPILKKNSEALKQIELIEKIQQQRKKNQLILEASAGAGVVGLSLLFVLIRRLIKKPASGVTVIEADKVVPSDILPTAEAVKSTVEDNILIDDKLLDLVAKQQTRPLQKPLPQEAGKEKRSPFSSTETPEPISISDSPTTPPAPPQIPTPTFDPLSAQKAAEERAAIQKSLAQAKKAADQKMPPVFKVEMPIPPITPQEPPVPVQPVFQSASPTFEDREEVIKVSQKMEKALQSGHRYAQDQKFEAARKEYRTVLALQPGAIDAYLGLGYADFIEGRWESALYYYVKALEVDPNSADAHYGIGRVLLETEQTDQAVEELRRSLQIDPHFNDARDTLALLGKAA